MALSRQQSLDKYGTEAYTAWGETEAEADWKATGGAKGRTGGGGGGGFDYQGYLQKREADLAAKEASARAEEEGLFGQFQEFFGARETIPQIAQRLGQEQGLPGLRATAQDLINQVEAIPETMTTAARGRDVSSNQLARIIMGKQASLAPEAQKSVQQAQTGEQLLNEALGYIMQGRQEEMIPWELKFNFLKDRVAREMSNFWEADESAIDLLTTKLEQQGYLDRIEMEKLSDLAIQEDKYTREKDLLDYKETLKGKAGGGGEFDWLTEAPNAVDTDGDGIPDMSVAPTTDPDSPFTVELSPTQEAMSRTGENLKKEGVLPWAWRQTKDLASSIWQDPFKQQKQTQDILGPVLWGEGYTPWSNLE